MSCDSDCGADSVGATRDVAMYAGSPDDNVARLSMFRLEYRSKSFSRAETVENSEASVVETGTFGSWPS